MIKLEPHVEIMRKIQESQKGCGVKIRTRAESDHLINERLIQLKIEGKTETKEYRFLSAIKDRQSVPLNLNSTK